jgi:hypothetical protein
MVVIMVRKKDLTRATKRHLPPMSAREQIVEGIVENLRPWKDGKSCHTVTAQVKEKLNELVKLASLLKKNTFDARRAGEYAKKLGKAIDKVEALLQSSPLRLWLRLFNPRTDMTGNFSKPPKPSESFEEMISGRKARAETVLAELARLRILCAQRFGYPPNYDDEKEACAVFAFCMLYELSARKITGTENAPFRTITGLLYEVVTGKENMDLKRACDQVLRIGNKYRF